MSSKSDLHSPEISVSDKEQDEKLEEELAKEISRISFQNESYHSFASKEAALRLKKHSHTDNPTGDTGIKLKAAVLRRCECKLDRSKELMSIEAQLLENLVSASNSQDSDPSLFAAANELSAKKERLHHAIRTIFDIFQSPVKFRIEGSNEIVSLALIDIVSLDLFNKANSIIMSFIEIIESLVSGDDNDFNPTNFHSILLKKESSGSQIQKINPVDRSKMTDSIDILNNDSFDKSMNPQNFSGIDSQADPHSGIILKTLSRSSMVQDDHMSPIFDKDSKRKQVKTPSASSVIRSPENRNVSSVSSTKNFSRNMMTDNNNEHYRSPINKLANQSLFDSISSKNDDLYVLEEYDDQESLPQSKFSSRNSSFLRLDHSPSYGLNNSKISSRTKAQSLYLSPSTPTRTNGVRNVNSNKSFENYARDNQLAHRSLSDANFANKVYPVFPGFANEYEEGQQKEEFIDSSSQQKIYLGDSNHSFTSRGGSSVQGQFIMEHDIMESNNISKPSPRLQRNVRRIINVPAGQDNRIISPSREIYSVNNSNYEHIESDRELVDEDAQTYNRKLFRELSNNGHSVDSHHNSVQYNQYNTSSPISYESSNNRRSSYRNNNNTQWQTHSYYSKDSEFDANILRQYNASIASSPIQYQNQTSPYREVQLSQYRGRPLASPSNRESAFLETNQFMESQRMDPRRIVTANAGREVINETLKQNVANNNNREGIDDMIIINGNKYMLFDQARNAKPAESNKSNKWKRHSSVYLDSMDGNSLLDDEVYKKGNSFFANKGWHEDVNAEILSSHHGFRGTQKQTFNKSKRNSYIV